MKWVRISLNRVKLLTVILLIPVMACSKATSSSAENAPTENTPSEMVNTLKVSVGNRVFQATLLNNQTAEAFKSLLPATVTMFELNGNEKYCELTSQLPTSAFNPETINEGDIMLYGASTLVLFYKTFPSAFRYTVVGRIDNPDGLRDALGAGSAVVSFELTENK